MNLEGQYAELKQRAEAVWQHTLDSFLWKGGIPDTRKDQAAVSDWARAFAMASVAFPEATERERDQLVRLHYARRGCIMMFSGALKVSEAEAVAAENHFCRCRDTVLANMGPRLTPLQHYVLEKEFLTIAFC
jgi:hypothetical protein